VSLRHRLRSALPALCVAGVFLGVQVGPVACTKGDGIVHGDVTVVSTDRSEWKLYSFDTEDVLRDGEGAPLSVEDPAAVEGWDLAIAQWVIATASGSSVTTATQSRGALLAVEGEVDEWPLLEDFTARCSDFGVAGDTANRQALSCNSDRTPTVDDGWIEDSLDDPDGAGPFPAIDYHPSVTFWFEYEFTGHEVLPYGNIYVIETRAGACVKLQLTDYYDADGAKGHVSFSWAWLPL
jgi:hypothetical protein